jgi:putative hemolysin
MDFLLIALLTLINGVFAMSELALAASRKARLIAMAEDGDKGAAAALRLLENPTRFLSTVQVGITSISVLTGIVGEAAFSARLSNVLQGWGLAPGAAGIAATAIVVALITFVSIIFGELVPKRIGQLYPENVARLMSRPMAWLARIASPFVKLLSATTTAVLNVLPIDTARERGVTQEEISHSLEEGVDAGIIEEQEHQMVRNVFQLDDRPLTSMMLPRSDIEWIDVSLTVRQCLERAAQGSAHSWYPVCRGSLDDVVGLVSVSRLLAAGLEHDGPVEPHVLPAAFVPETLTGMELLEQFRRESQRLVFVVDEYGVVQGLVTPQDVLEAITGELRPDVHGEAWATPRDDGSWLLDGLMPVAELKARLDIDALPDEDRNRYNTVAGLLLAVTGHLPQTGERIECAGWCFEVVDLDGRRIDKVLATRLTAEALPDGAKKE